MSKAKVIVTSGTRKRAIARASLMKGTGMVRVNSKRVDNYEPHMLKMKIMEPLILAGDTAKEVNITVRTHGGGIAGQADAARLAIGRALALYNKKLRDVFLDYDRALLVADSRLKEACKQTILKQEQRGKNHIGDTKMIIPVRCFSCGKPVAHLWTEYKERVAKGEERKKVMDSLGLERCCCRGMFLGHVDLIDTAGQFKKF